MEQQVKYSDTEINAYILKAVREMGFEYMTPIQEQAIPVLLEGKDVIGQAQTGTGKTAAFSIPMIQKIDISCKKPQGIILCPTRELAMQAAEEIRKIAVEIVVDFHAARLNGTAHGHRAAAAEHINEPAVVIRRHLVDDPQQLALAAHPWDKAVQGASPPSSGRES